ncbi:hypothetical protein TNCV_4469151 [Trichonephila clavipes]|nr:hypothetical protein TNCV_4469151 [Trichonephila clavipes]
MSILKLGECGTCSGVAPITGLWCKFYASGITVRGGPWRTAPSTVFVALGDKVQEQMFRSGGQSDVKAPVFSSQASLVLIYQPTEFDLAHPGV